VGHVLHDLTPNTTGWEEFHSRANASAAVGPGASGAIIEAWSKYKAADVVKLGYRAVEADGSKFYLNHLHPVVGAVQVQLPLSLYHCIALNHPHLHQV
jgi:hypothetical protein